MKPIFAIDLTEDRNNRRMNAEAFLSHALVTSEQGGVTELTRLDGREDASLTEYGAEKKKKLSRREKKELKEREKEEKSYDDKTRAAIAVSGALSEAYSDVGVPEDADSVDILSFSYVIKKDKLVPVIPEDGYTAYVNLPMRAYVRDRRLCLADLCHVYSFDLESVKSITKVKTKTEFPFWNKAEELDKELSKLYSVKLRHGIYTTKYHYALTLIKDDEEHVILFPPYEIATFERLAEVSFWED
jgi:hypothetical protein